MAFRWFKMHGENSEGGYFLVRRQEIKLPLAIPANWVLLEVDLLLSLDDLNGR